MTDVSNQTPVKRVIATLDIRTHDVPDAAVSDAQLGNTTNVEARFLVDGEVFRVGRISSNDLAIHDQNVSRFHAILNATATGLVVSDLGSLNGTFINGKRISTPTGLNNGDVVSIGNTQIHVTLNSGDEDNIESALRTQAARLQAVSVCVLVADVCQYTRLSEALPGTVVTEMLQKWFEVTGRIVRDNGGQVDKFIGDCVMALWTSPLSEARTYAKEALAAAVQIVSATQKLAADLDFEAKHSLPWSCRVALNSGEALMGAVGGRDGRDFTVMGDAINVAFRLEDVAKELGQQILFSSSLSRLVEDSFPVRELGEVAVDGRKEPVRVFSLTRETA